MMNTAQLRSALIDAASAVLGVDKDQAEVALRQLLRALMIAFKDELA